MAAPLAGRWLSQARHLWLAREVFFMTLRCLVRGHRWGPPEGAGRSFFHTCGYCGKTKHLSGEPRAERHDKKGGYP